MRTRTRTQSSKTLWKKWKKKAPKVPDITCPIIDDVLHYSVANMPGAVPMTSTEALTNATIAYAIEIANKGWKKACNENEPLKKGLNIINGNIVYKAVAEAFDLNYTELNI